MISCSQTILNELNTVKTKSKKSLESQKKIYGRMFGLEKPEESKKAKENEVSLNLPSNYIVYYFL